MNELKTNIFSPPLCLIYYWSAWTIHAYWVQIIRVLDAHDPRYRLLDGFEGSQRSKIFLRQMWCPPNVCPCVTERSLESVGQQSLYIRCLITPGNWNCRSVATLEFDLFMGRSPTPTVWEMPVCSTEELYFIESYAGFSDRNKLNESEEEKVCKFAKLNL